MKYKIEISELQKEDIIISARERSPLLDRLEAMLTEENNSLIGYSKDKILKLDLGDIFCFFSEDGKVFAQTENERYQIKERLYQIEERYNNFFVKINQSCLVNVKKIKRFSSSIGGSLMVILDNGYRDYISRRQLKAVKERIGF